MCKTVISGDTSPEVMWMGVKNGAQHFLVKPIKANDVKHIWQYSFWWKKIKANNTAPITHINSTNDGDILSSATICTVGDDTIGNKLVNRDDNIFHTHTHTHTHTHF